MSSMAYILLIAGSYLVPLAIILSFLCKNAYLYRKLQNRCSKEEMEKVDKVQNDFWVFLK